MRLTLPVALDEAKIDSLMTEREGDHGGPVWRGEVPRRRSWAFDR